MQVDDSESSVKSKDKSGGEFGPSVRIVLNRQQLNLNNQISTTSLQDMFNKNMDLSSPLKVEDEGTSNNYIEAALQENPL